MTIKYICTSINSEQGGRKDTPLYLLSELGAGDVIDGPAIILDNTTSTVVEPDCRAEVTDSGDVKITIGSGARKKIGYVTMLNNIR